MTIIHRRDEFRASKIMAERALSNPKIDVAWNTVVDEILGTDGKVSGVRVRDVKTGEHARSCRCTGVFVAIGHDPRSELFRGQVDLDDEGYVLVESPSTPHQPAGRLRRRRPGRPHLPPGDHRRRHRLRRRPRRRALSSSLNPRVLTRGDTPMGTAKHGHRRLLRRRRPAVRQARPGGLLGRVVRTVPQGRPGARGDRQRDGDKVTVVKLDIDANPETARAYRVMSVPTLTIFKGGKPVHSVAGAKPKADIVRLIEAAL